MSRYHKTIRTETVDVYDVLIAFGVTCPATQHAIKKLLMPGQRGAKTLVQDLEEAKQSVDRAISIAKENSTDDDNELNHIMEKIKKTIMARDSA